jgi:hypothetical protein
VLPSFRSTFHNPAVDDGIGCSECSGSGQIRFRPADALETLAFWRSKALKNRAFMGRYLTARADAMRPVRWLAHFDRLALDRKATRFDSNRHAASFYDVLGERFNTMFARVAA